LYVLHNEVHHFANGFTVTMFMMTEFSKMLDVNIFKLVMDRHSVLL